jgi:hypothetical protein
VIEQRVRSACEKQNVDYVEPWSGLFASSYRNVPIREWLLSSILPRPRDLIEFTERAMVAAVDADHSRVEEKDLEKALKKYSAWALDQLYAEYQAEAPWLPAIVDSFLMFPSSFTLVDLIRHLKRTRRTDATPKEIAGRLVEVGFLGIEGLSGTRYAASIQDAGTLRTNVSSHSSLRPLRLTVHPVFRHHLDTRSSERKRPPFSLMSVGSLVRQIVATTRERSPSA